MHANIGPAQARDMLLLGKQTGFEIIEIPFLAGIVIVIVTVKHKTVTYTSSEIGTSRVC